MLTLTLEWATEVVAAAEADARGFEDSLAEALSIVEASACHQLSDPGKEVESRFRQVRCNAINFVE